MDNKLNPEYLADTMSVSTSSEIDQLAMAMADSRVNMTHPRKDKTAKVKGFSKKTNKPYEYEYDYPSMPSMLTSIEIALKKGLSYVLLPIPAKDDMHFGLAVRLMHKSGQFIHTEFQVPLHNSDPQSIGATMSLFHRYVLQGLFGIAAEDPEDMQGITLTAGLDYTPITPQQAAVITTVISSNNMPQHIVNEMCKAYGASSLEALPGDKFDEIMNRLDQKISRIQKKMSQEQRDKIDG